MPTFSMTDLKRLAGLVPEPGSSTSRHQPDSSTSQRLPVKPDIRRDIYTAVMMAGQPVRRAEIAKLLGLKKTPWLCAAIEELVIAGYLRKDVQQRPNQLDTFYYSVAAALPAPQSYWGELPDWLTEQNKGKS